MSKAFRGPVQRFIGGFILGGIAGWLVLVGLVTAWIYSMPEDQTLGRGGFVVIWCMVFTVFYLINFICLTIFARGAFRREFRRVGLWLQGAFGGITFALSVPIWCAMAGFLNESVLTLAAIGMPAGFVSFYMHGWLDRAPMETGF